jgi:hypothetical protein
MKEHVFVFLTIFVASCVFVPLVIVGLRVLFDVFVFVIEKATRIIIK